MKQRFIYDENDAPGITIYRRSRIRKDEQRPSTANDQATQSETGLPPLLVAVLED